MKTKNDIFHTKCGIIKTFDTIINDLEERREETLDEICELMNDIFTKDIQGLGFSNIHFALDESEYPPQLFVYFEEENSPADFKTEEEWIDYECKNMRLGYEYFNKIEPDLDILCIPMKKDET